MTRPAYEDVHKGQIISHNCHQVHRVVFLVTCVVESFEVSAYFVSEMTAVQTSYYIGHPPVCYVKNLDFEL